MELVQCTASLPGGSGQCNFMQYTAAPPGGTGQWNSSDALSNCLGVVVSAIPVMYYHVASGHWALELLPCTVSLLGGSGRCIFLQYPAKQP